MAEFDGKNMIELDGVNLLKHSSIRINKGKIIYIDPFQIDIANHDADLVLCTHSHYDHFSPDDIKAVSNESTVLITTPDTQKDVEKMGFLDANVQYAKPGDRFDYEGIIIECIPAYNKFKEFHPKSRNWLGYLLKINDITYYIAGDTDKTKEACQVECDVAFLPVGGTYTMTYAEAASLANKIKPKYAIPTHYGLIVGETEDGSSFARLLDKEIESRVFF